MTDHACTMFYLKLEKRNVIKKIIGKYIYST